MKKINYLFSVLICFGVFITSCEKEVSYNKNIEIPIIADYELLKINAEKVFEDIKIQSSNGEVNVDLSNLNPDWKFLMNKERLYSNDAKVEQLTETGSYKVKPEKAYFLSGIDKVGNLSLLVSRKSGLRLEYIKNGQLFIVEPLSRHLPESNNNEYIHYLSDNIIFKNGECDLVSQDSKSNDHNLKSVVATRFVELSVIGEGTWFAEEGNNSWRVIEDIVFFGGARYWYFSSFDLRPVLDYNGVYTNGHNIIPNPSNSLVAVNEWRNFGNSNSWYPKRDAHVLFTGRTDITSTANSNNIAIGRTFGLGLVCSNPNNSYMWVGHRDSDFEEFQNFAHELAHLFNGQHQTSGNGPLANGGLVNQTSTNFHSNAENQMENYINNNNNCL